MTYIVLASESADFRARLQAATAGSYLPLPPAPLPTDPAELFSRMDGAPPPEIVVIDGGPQGTERALQLAANFGQQCPGIGLILVSDRPAEVGLAAMRAGVRDILHPTAEVAEIQDALDRAALALPSRLADGTADGRAPAGRVISVVSPKGGVGKTTVSTNLAVGLAQAVPHSTVLVDLDVQFGDVGTALNLNPQYTLPDTVHGPASTDTMVLKTFLTQHETGLYVICGTDTPAAADTVTPDGVGQLLQMLASEFQFVVVDTAPGLVEHTLAVLDHTTDPVLLTSMDVPGVRGLRKEIETLDALEMFSDGRHVVLNFADPRSGLSVSDVEATINAKVDLLLPRSKAATASVNMGVPLLQSRTRDPMTKKLTELVERFAPVPVETGRRRGRHRAHGGGRR